MRYRIHLQFAIVAVAWLWGFWALVEMTDAGADFMLVLMLLLSAGVIAVGWTCCFAAASFAPNRGDGSTRCSGRYLCSGLASSIWASPMMP